MTQDDSWTIGKLLGWTQQYLTDRDAESPRLDAEILLAFARGCKRIELYTAFDEVASEELRTKYRELVRRRAEGTPVAYLVGSKEFYSLPFRVTPDVLIPRPETEFLVVRVLDLAKELRASDSPRESVAVVDVGTGSGILAICLARHLPDSQMTAIDISPTALQVARENSSSHEVTDRIRFLEGDLLAPVATEKFDFVVSNPPYVSTSEYEELAPDVKDHEPRQALVAGERGTEVIAELINQSATVLSPHGWLLVEVSPMIAAEVQALLERDGRYDEVRITKDLAHHPRIVEARRTRQKA